MDRPGGPPKAGASGVPDDLSGGGDVHGNLRGGDRQDDPVARGAENRGRAHLFDRPEGEEARGEADGTGIGIKGIKKRGKELKVLIQYMKGGTVRVAGLDIGSYKGHWGALFKKSLPALKEFKSFFLVTDGETSILDGLKGTVKVLTQRCLWHIPHRATRSRSI